MTPAGPGGFQQRTQGGGAERLSERAGNPDPAKADKPQPSASPPEPKTEPKFEAPARITEPGPTDTRPQELREPIAVDDNLWPEILNALKKRYNTLYGIARMAQPTFYEDRLELAFGFAFHKRRLSETKNKDIVCTVIKQLTGKDMGLSCILISKSNQAATPITKPTQASVPAVAPASPDLSAISNIFGGAEVLGS